MKRIGLLFVAAGLLSLAACSSASAEEEKEGNDMFEAITYTVDIDNSVLAWSASMNPEYGHQGTVNFSSGSITMEGETLTEGSFVVDMASIKNTDQEGDKAMALEGHLKGTMVDENHPQNMFFNTPEYPTVEVRLGEYKDGILSTTLLILGSELTEDVPVTIEADENGASIKGKFSMDFSALKMPGLEPSEHGAISPDFKFELNVMLKK